MTRELSERYHRNLMSIMYEYDNKDIAKAIFDICSAKKWASSLGIELLKLVHEFYHE